MEQGCMQVPVYTKCLEQGDDGPKLMQEFDSTDLKVQLLSQTCCDFMMINGLQMNNVLFENNDFTAVRSFPGFQEATKSSTKVRVSFKFIDLRLIHLSDFLRQGSSTKSNHLHLSSFLRSLKDKYPSTFDEQTHFKSLIDSLYDRFNLMARLQLALVLVFLACFVAQMHDKTYF